jgi:hypothetical protein
VAVFKEDETTPANLASYGDYLVTAQVKTAGSWNQLDPNVAFDAFAFKRLGTSGSGTGGDLKPLSRARSLRNFATGFNAGTGRRPATTHGYCGCGRPQLACLSYLQNIPVVIAKTLGQQPS